MCFCGMEEVFMELQKEIIRIIKQIKSQEKLRCIYLFIKSMLD